MFFLALFNLTCLPRFIPLNTYVPLAVASAGQAGWLLAPVTCPQGLYHRRC